MELIILVDTILKGEMKRALRCDVEVLSNNSNLSMIFQCAIEIIWNSLHDYRSLANAYGVTCV